MWRGLLGDQSFFKGDVRDRDLLRSIFAATPIGAVIHFAGFEGGIRLPSPAALLHCNVGGDALCRDGRGGSKDADFQFLGRLFMGIRRRCWIREDFSMLGDQSLWRRAN